MYEALLGPEPWPNPSLQRAKRSATCTVDLDRQDRATVSKTKNEFFATVQANTRDDTCLIIPFRYSLHNTYMKHKSIKTFLVCIEWQRLLSQLVGDNW